MIAEATNDSHTMPAAIAEAVVKVMGSVKRLERTEENKFARYNYTSVDGFLEAIGPLCAAAGLFILADETEKEITTAEKADREGTTNFLTIKWAFMLGHATGALYGPLHRTVTVPAMGAQAYGSSQSYALKQFMRGLFQIPTGDDDDADAQEKQQLPSRQRASQPSQSRQPAGDFPACPKCGSNTAVIASKFKDKGDWCCFDKKGGCKHQWFNESTQPESPPEPGDEKQSNPKVLQDIVGLIAKATDLDKIAKLADYIDKKRSEGFLMPKDADMLTAQVEAKDKLIRTQEPVGV